MRSVPAILGFTALFSQTFAESSLQLFGCVFNIYASSRAKLWNNEIEQPLLLKRAQACSLKGCNDERYPAMQFLILISMQAMPCIHRSNNLQPMTNILFSELTIQLFSEVLCTLVCSLTFKNKTQAHKYGELALHLLRCAFTIQITELRSVEECWLLKYSTVKYLHLQSFALEVTC